MLSYSSLHAYWSSSLLEANLLVILHLMGALCLGFAVGYERTFHGRAAGMRTYGLVCMACTAVTVIGGHSQFWYGGNVGPIFTNGDLSRVVQGVLTGLGFLCAGVIMKDGFTISGLTTAASLWAVAVMGVLVGVGLYAAAIMMALLSAFCMAAVSKIETWLPSQQAIAVTLKFVPGFEPLESALRKMAHERNYDIVSGSLVISRAEEAYSWSFLAVARNRQTMTSISTLAAEMGSFPGVSSFNVAYART